MLVSSTSFCILYKFFGTFLTLLMIQVVTTYFYLNSRGSSLFKLRADCMLILLTTVLSLSWYNYEATKTGPKTILESLRTLQQTRATFSTRIDIKQWFWHTIWAEIKKFKFDLIYFMEENIYFILWNELSQMSWREGVTEFRSEMIR